jgi:DNA-binding XRE family transcriptional regulator
MNGPKLASTVAGASAELRHCVRRARRATGLNRDAAARDVGVSSDSIKRWEGGKTKPDFAKLFDAPVMGPAFRAELERLLASRRRAA